jgi:hypothetical protein
LRLNINPKNPADLLAGAGGCCIVSGAGKNGRGPASATPGKIPRRLENGGKMAQSELLKNEYYEYEYTSSEGNFKLVRQR